MKFLSFHKDITTNHKENLLLAYAFINNKLLYKPECSFINSDPKELPEGDYIFGKDTYSAVYGNEYEIPSWEKFYEMHKNDVDAVYTCVAGCDDKDATKITIAFLPKEAMQDMSEEHKGILVSVSETLGKKKVQYIIDNILELFEQYKAIYL